MVDLIQIVLIITNSLLIAGMLLIWRLMYCSGRQLNKEIRKIKDKPIFNQSIGVS